VFLKLEVSTLCGKIESYRAGSALIMLPLLTTLVFTGSAIVVARLALANGATVQTAPHLQADSGYWTQERMRSAKPLMPTVPGTPKSGSAVSRRSGPTGGLPGRGPEVQPDRSDRQ
jgi:hypothetical protein